LAPQTIRQGEITVRVPATTANLGPGFDCLGLALDLWNSAIFRVTAGESRVDAQGEGADQLPRGHSNLILQAASLLFEHCGKATPGLHLRCINQIPLGSGLGSSAAAVLLGLMGANDLLDLAVRLEGHPDNAAAALYGGVVTVIRSPADRWLVRRFDLPDWQAAYVLPEIDFPTHLARAALPGQVMLADAVFNIGRAALVLEALRTSDPVLLGAVMEDRLHQPYRLPLIPGAAAALAAACRSGGAAALSGAGPSVIAFLMTDPGEACRAMTAAFAQAGITARALALQTTNRGAEVSFSEPRPD
jgi:homoserine kinase